MKIGINHFSWLFLPDFHKPIPFQIAVQIIKGINQIKLDVSNTILITSLITKKQKYYIKLPKNNPSIKFKNHLIYLMT